jgi:hypothetical protein
LPARLLFLSKLRAAGPDLHGGRYPTDLTQYFLWNRENGLSRMGRTDRDTIGSSPHFLWDCLISHRDVSAHERFRWATGTHSSVRCRLQHHKLPGFPVGAGVPAGPFNDRHGGRSLPRKTPGCDRRSTNAGPYLHHGLPRAASSGLFTSGSAKSFLLMANCCKIRHLRKCPVHIALGAKKLAGPIPWISR